MRFKQSLGLVGDPNLALKVKRDADEFYLDFNDVPPTFRATGAVVDDDTAMSEPNAARAPGEYETTVDESGWNDGVYTCYYVYSGAPAFIVAAEFSIVDGQEAWEANETDLDTIITNVGALQDISAADVLAQTTAALNTYDPPTRAELTTDKNEIITEVDANETKIDALNNLSQAESQAAATAALNAYDPPTKAEMDAAHALLATAASIAALNNVSVAEVLAQATAALNAYDPPTRAEATADRVAIIAEVDANEAKIDIIDTNVDDIETIAVLVNKWLNNRMAFVGGTTLVLYDDDTVTPLLTWTLSNGTLTVAAPYNRSAAV